MNIIAISGKPGSTKMFYAFCIIKELRFHKQNAQWETLATPLYEEFNEIASKAKTSAKPPKEILQELNLNLGAKGLELIQFLQENDLGEKHPDYGFSRRVKAVREGLAFLGTEIRRAQDPEYLLKKLLARAKADRLDFAVVTDIRFPEEADAIRNEGGVVLRAEPAQESNEGGYKYQDGLLDPAETALDDYTGFCGHYTTDLFDEGEFTRFLSEFYEFPLQAEVIR